MQFFESMIQTYQEELSKPIMMRRSSIRKEDPLEELSDLYSEIKDQENKFKKCIEVCAFIIEKNKELYSENQLLQQDFEKQLQRQTMIEDQNNSLFQDNRSLQEINKNSKQHIVDLENLINELKMEIDQKNNMLEDYERNVNDSRQSDRFTMNNGALISAQDLQELKNNLADKLKKCKEFDQMLNSQNANYQMELKKSYMLLNENKKLKEQTKELNFQIEEFQEIVEEKDQEIDELNAAIKELEKQVSIQQFAKKSQTFQKKNSAQLTTPLAQTQMTIVRQKSRIDDGLITNEPDLRKKNSYVINQIINEQITNPQRKKENFIRVKSQMEDFREIQHHRKGSCPLVVVDKNSMRFQIYDKQYEKYKEQQLKMKELETYLDSRPGHKSEKKKASDDKVVAPPPEYYPFNDLEKVVEEAQVKLRLPSSLRFQTEYVSKIGLHLQDILNRQQLPQQIQERDESEQDDENDQDMIDTETMNQDQITNNHGTFRPISILDRAGLDLNEDDFMYDQPTDNVRGTLYMTGDFQNPDYSRTERGVMDNYESFVNRNGSMMLEAGIMTGSGEQYDSPDGNKRESMYKKGSFVNRNKLSFMQNSILDNRKNGGNNYVEVESKIQEMADEEDQDSITKRQRSSLYKKTGLKIITDDVDENYQRGSKEIKPIVNHMETPSFQQKAKFSEHSSAFLESDQKTSLRVKQTEEDKKQGSHQKKQTDSTTVGRSAINNQSPQAVVTKEEIQAINDQRQNVQYQSIVSNSQPSIGGFYSHNHYNSQNFKPVDNLAVMDPHHLRGFSSNPPTNDNESQSPSKTNNDNTSRQGTESIAGRGSHSGGSGTKSPTQQSRKDPNEEFFMMTLLSYKLNHKEYEKILTVQLKLIYQTLLQIDPREMYLQAQKEKIAFYGWQKWIETKLERIYNQ